MITLADLYEEPWGNEQVPLTDRDDLPALSEIQFQWRNHGVVKLPSAIHDGLIDAYQAEWLEHNADRPGGWPYCTPHRNHPALADLVCAPAIGDVIEELLDEPGGVHLTLTGWVTTTRDWHSDQYLNEPHVGGYYVAAWICLEDVDPRSGPFQYIPGSHTWPPISQRKIKEALGPDGSDPAWPAHSERILTPLFEEKIANDGLNVVAWLPRRGDVLLWHGRLVHRGSIAEVPGMHRGACIAHYSGINHRQDMPPAYQTHGGWMFPVDGGPV